MSEWNKNICHTISSDLKSTNIESTRKSRKRSRPNFLLLRTFLKFKLMWCFKTAGLVIEVWTPVTPTINQTTTDQIANIELELMVATVQYCHPLFVYNMHWLDQSKSVGKWKRKRTQFWRCHFVFVFGIVCRFLRMCVAWCFVFCAGKSETNFKILKVKVFFFHHLRFVSSAVSSNLSLIIIKVHKRNESFVRPICFS